MNSVISRATAVASTIKKTLTDYVTTRDIVGWASTRAQAHIYTFYEEREQSKQENPYFFLFSFDGMTNAYETRRKYERTIAAAEGYRLLRIAAWSGISIFTNSHLDKELYAYLAASMAAVEFAAAYAIHTGRKKAAPFVEKMRKKHGRKTIDNIFTDDMNDVFNAFNTVFGAHRRTSDNNTGRKTTIDFKNGMTDDKAYALLGLGRTASKADIRSAYCRLAKETHPDHNKGDKRKEEQFRQVAEAYNFLTRKTGQRQAVN